VSAVQISHLFVTRMLAKKQRGCVVFTSSAAACQPGPFASMYGATKAFISSFGASLAVEVRSSGIDVTVVHPSPVASRFYDKAHALDSIAFFKLFNVAPDALPDMIFASIGRVVWRDIGAVAVAFRVMMKFIVRGTAFCSAAFDASAGFQPHGHAAVTFCAANGRCDLLCSHAASH